MRVACAATHGHARPWREDAICTRCSCPRGARRFPSLPPHTCLTCHTRPHTPLTPRPARGSMTLTPPPLAALRANPDPRLPRRARCRWRLPPQQALSSASQRGFQTSPGGRRRARRAPASIGVHTIARGHPYLLKRRPQLPFTPCLMRSVHTCLTQGRDPFPVAQPCPPVLTPPPPPHRSFRPLRPHLAPEVELLADDKVGRVAAAGERNGCGCVCRMRRKRLAGPQATGAVHQDIVGLQGRCIGVLVSEADALTRVQCGSTPSEGPAGLGEDLRGSGTRGVCSEQASCIWASSFWKADVPAEAAWKVSLHIL
eukprot:223386-Chlamydomonas_euryale.AAC.1